MPAGIGVPTGMVAGTGGGLGGFLGGVGDAMAGRGTMGMLLNQPAWMMRQMGADPTTAQAIMLGLAANPLQVQAGNTSFQVGGGGGGIGQAMLMRQMLKGQMDKAAEEGKGSILSDEGGTGWSRGKWNKFIGQGPMPRILGDDEMFRFSL